MGDIKFGQPAQRHLGEITKDLDTIIELLNTIAENTTQTNLLINQMNSNLQTIGEALNNWSKPVQLRKVKVPKEDSPDELEEVSLHRWDVVKDTVDGEEVEEAVAVVEDSEKKIRAVKAKKITIED